MINTDKAYLLGLIIGGGIFNETENTFRIQLPYNHWGTYKDNPERPGIIARDVLQVVGPMFREVYNINIFYNETKSGTWNIICEGDLSYLKTDLDHYGINWNGEIRKNAEIDLIISELIDDNLKRRFIAGLADTIGSVARSHRRFSDNKQIISFEISGFKFDFVLSLCQLLHSIGCYPDQILWNHPNFHSSLNPNYDNWNKGFKLRVLLDQYDKFGAFAFTSKAQSVIENKRLEKDSNIALPCSKSSFREPTVTSVHSEENSDLLPEKIRGGHYLHSKHICAVLGCPYAPYSFIDNLLSHAEDYINPFPVLMKGNKEIIKEAIQNHPVLKECTYTETSIKFKDLLKLKDKPLLYSKDNKTGYRTNYIISAAAFLAAASIGRLNGLRPSGNQNEIFRDLLLKYPEAKLKIYIPDLMSALVLTMKSKAALVGAQNPEIYKKLIQKDSENPYKISVRPIKIEDLIGKETN